MLGAASCLCVYVRGAELWVRCCSFKCRWICPLGQVTAGIHPAQVLRSFYGPGLGLWFRLGPPGVELSAWVLFSRVS